MKGEYVLDAQKFTCVTLLVAKYNGILRVETYDMD